MRTLISTTLVVIMSSCRLILPPTAMREHDDHQSLDAAPDFPTATLVNIHEPLGAIERAGVCPPQNVDCMSYDIRQESIKITKW